MTYIIIISALFVIGIAYILLAGVDILKEDDKIQDQIQKTFN